MRHRAEGGISTILLAALLAVSCSAPGSSPEAPPGKAGPLTIAGVAGCYEMGTIRWRSEPKAEEKRFVTPPRAFELTLEPFESAPSYYKVANRVDRSEQHFSTWRLENDRQLFINWGTGFVGVSVLAERAEGASTFRGIAETYSDQVDGTAGHQAEVRFAPVPCSARN